LRYHCIKFVATYKDVFEVRIPDELSKDVKEYIDKLKKG